MLPVLSLNCPKNHPSGTHQCCGMLAPSPLSARASPPLESQTSSEHSLDDKVDGGREEKAFRNRGRKGLVPPDTASLGCCHGTVHSFLTWLLWGLGQGALHCPAVGVVTPTDPTFVLLLQGAWLVREGALPENFLFLLLAYATSAHTYMSRNHCCSYYPYYREYLF